MALRSVGSGHVGLATLLLQCTPASALTAEITALIAAGTEVNGTFVEFSNGGNYEVSVVTDGDFAEGQIVHWGSVIAGTYWIECGFFGYLDNAGGYHSVSRIETLPYTAEPSVGDSIVIDTNRLVKSAGAGQGRVIKVDTTNNTVDVIM